ncbi:MAG: ABC transporter permease, partial [Bacteroidota bacterium]
QANLYPAADIVAGHFSFQNGIQGVGSWCFTVDEVATKDELTIIGTKGKLSISFFGAPEIILEQSNPKSKQKFSFDKPLIKVFTFTQSILAFLAISISFFFIKNENYLKDKDLGYETDNKVVIKINNIKSKELLYANLQSNLNVQNISYSVNRLGLNGIQTNVMFRDIVFKADLYEVGYGYLEQMDISMVEGRFFDTNLDVNTNGVLINRNLFETYLKSKLRLGSTTMKINDTNYTILGIVENTFTNLSSDKDNLVIFKVCSLNDANYIIASFDAINREKVLKSIEDSWNETEKETPIDSFFYDEIFLTYIIWVTGHRKVMTFVAIISIVLSVIGLFSLMSLKVSSKLKSFCIMKILGISELSLFIRLGKDLLWITALTLISGVPLSLWITKLLFSIVYIDHVPITPLIPSITSAIFFLIFFSITIVNFQKVIEKDPIQLIRSD